MMNASVIRRTTLALIAALPVTATAVPEWRLASTSTLAEPTRLAAFADPRAGVLLGGPWLLYTRDGGRTWEDGPTLDPARHALEVLPDGFAWHAGVLTVGRSFDGGRTWYRGGRFGGGDPEPAVFLSFADENRGLIATRARLGLTLDGGLRWTSIALPGLAEEVAAVSLSLAPAPPDDAPPAVALHGPRRVVGRVLDTAGRLWVTYDLGANWSFAESPIAGRRFHVAGGVPTTALRFTRSGAGVLAAFVEANGGARLRVFRSAADGAEWVEERVPLVETPGALFLSPDARVLTWTSLERDELRVYVRQAY
jgi:photosystem II stability/assembly factor-like uncharacterized protein